MDARKSERCVAFSAADKIAEGAPRDVAVAMKAMLDADPGATLRAFDEETAQPLEFDLRGSAADVAGRYGADEPRGPGRPRLGVTAREVTLLPRHWEWLAAQPGGASVTLRKLVETASRASENADRARAAQEKAYRFMAAAVGDQPGFEEACRALFACDEELFGEIACGWPTDLAAFATRLAGPAFEPGAADLRRPG